MSPRRPMVALYLTVALSTVTIGVSSTVLPLYVLALGGTSADWGTLYACFAIAMGLGEMVIGTLSDRFGIRLAMGASRLVSGLITVWVALLPGLGALYVAQALRGVADAAIWPLGKSHIGRTVPARSKGTHLGLFSMMAGIGTSLGAAAGGAVLGLAGFTPAFLIATATSLAAAGVALGGMVEAPQHALASQHGQRPAGRLRSGSNPSANDDRPIAPAAASYVLRFVSIALVTVILVAAWAAASSALPVIASVDVGLGPTEVGILVSGFGLTTTLLALPSGRLADRFGRRRAIVAGLTAMALSMVGFAFFDTFLPLLLTVVLNAVGWSLANPARGALLSDNTPAARQGTAMGWMGAVEDTGMALGGGLAGLLLVLFGRTSTFAAFGCLVLVGILICLLTIREQEWRREAARRWRSVPSG